MEDYRENFSGGTFDRLGQESQILTAYCWELGLHEEASATFIEGLRSIGLESVADAIETFGINFFIIASGESDPYSGFVYPSNDATTGEWYADIPPGIRKELVEILDDNDQVADKVGDLRAEFEESVIKALP